MIKKYLVCPGYMISKHDGQWHYISAGELMHLYEVDRKECAILDQFFKGEEKDFIMLRPLYDGNYREWLAENEKR